ncbi:MAG: methionine--tRNA ligase [Patescibacteria group bacterium]
MTLPVVIPSKPKNKVFIGVAWPYVNGDLHIGHYAGYLLPSDICARYNRLRGRDVLMVSGSDCFGTPITVEADKSGKTPKEVVAGYHARDVELFDLLGLSYDLYTKTDTENHKKVTQDIFLKLLEKGYIFKGVSMQYYSNNENRFLPDRYVEGKCPKCGFDGARSDQCEKCGAVLDQGELLKPVSRVSGSPVVLKESEHYFLDWPLFQEFLEEYVEMPHLHELGWRDWVFNETLGWLKQGLKARAITRDLDWGVELPLDRIPNDQKISGIENKRIYVWFDAVIGYLSASIEWGDLLKKGDWRKFWFGGDSTHYYFMGKDNLIFHTLFWPGQLHGYDEKLNLPNFFAINQFLNLEGKKFSKSREVIVDTRYAVEKYGNDILRFYLCLIMPENSDANFSWEDFYQKVNNVLIGNFGNLINRVLTLAKDVDFLQGSYEVDTTVFEKVKAAYENACNHLDHCEYKSYLEAVLKLSSFANEYLTSKEPWKNKDNKKAYDTVVKNLTFAVLVLTDLLLPLIPDTCQKVYAMLSIQKPDCWKDVLTRSKDLRVVKVSEAKPLFKKIEKGVIDEEKSKVALV